MSKTRSTLFNTFDKRTKADWLAKVTKELKGKAIEDLDWQLLDGLSISPFAHQEDLSEAFAPIPNNRSTNNWEIGVMVKVKDYALANREALSLLEHGATAICFKLQNTPTKGQLNILLENIQLEWMSTHFLVRQESWKRMSEYFLSIIKEKGQDPQKVNCSFDVKGNPINEKKEVAHFREILSQLPKGNFLTVNTCSLFAKKENVVNALAETIAQGNALLALLHQQRFDIASIHSSVQFAIGLADSYFLNIATIRSLRLLWQQVITAWDENLISVSPIIIHLGVDSQTEDENYNKIKAGAQAMSAIIGGADRLFISPSDEKLGNSTPFSQRIALNIQHVMQLESYMDRVIDPAAGSYYIEKLTQDLAEASWSAFQQKQNKG